MGQAGRYPAGLGQALPDEDLPLGGPEGVPRPPKALRQLAHQGGDDEEDAPGDEHGDQHGPQRGPDDMLGAEGGDEAEVEAVGEDAEEDGGQRRGQEPGPAGDDQARRDDREEVEEVHRRGEPARDVDEGGDEEEVEDDLDVGLGDEVPPPGVEGEEDGREGVGADDEIVEGQVGLGVGRGQLDDEGRDEKRRQDDEPVDVVEQDAPPLHRPFPLTGRDIMAWTLSRLALPCVLELLHEAEDRQVHRDDQAADHGPDEDEHDGLENGEHGGHRVVDLLVVEIGQLRQHLVEGARGLADVDHLEHHRRELPGQLEGFGHRLAFGDELAGVDDLFFDDDVAGRRRGDLQGLEHGHAAGDEGRQRPGHPGHGHLVEERAEDRHLQDQAVGRPAAGASCCGSSGRGRTGRRCRRRRRRCTSGRNRSTRRPWPSGRAARRRDRGRSWRRWG